VSDLAYQKLFNTGIGRKEELASDRIGVELAAAAGYRSAAYVNFLEGLQALATAKSSSFEQLGSTHPGPDDRLNSIRPRLSDSGQLLADRWEKNSR
jgi:predicted Zn-dependent protease